jgi:hypothetical protein
LLRIENELIKCFELKKEDVENKIAIQLLYSIPLDNNTVICGDLNARMGKTSVNTER